MSKAPPETKIQGNYLGPGHRGLLGLGDSEVSTGVRITSTSKALTEPVSAEDNEVGAPSVRFESGDAGLRRRLQRDNAASSRGVDLTGFSNEAGKLPHRPDPGSRQLLRALGRTAPKKSAGGKPNTASSRVAGKAASRARSFEGHGGWLAADRIELHRGRRILRSTRGTGGGILSAEGNSSASSGPAKPKASAPAKPRSSLRRGNGNGLTEKAAAIGNHILLDFDPDSGSRKRLRRG